MKSNAPPWERRKLMLLTNSPPFRGSTTTEQSECRWGGGINNAGTLSDSLTGRKSLLKMRDGPRGRPPETGVPVTLILHHFVFLCVSSVPSVVKKDDTIDDRKSAENAKRYATHSIRTEMTAITARHRVDCRRKEEVRSVQSQCADLHCERIMMLLRNGSQKEVIS